MATEDALGWKGSRALAMVTLLPAWASTMGRGSLAGNR